MGRKKKALDGAAPYHDLAQWLRRIRDEAKLTYKQMTRRVTIASYSAVTLSRSDNGDFLPKLEVVEAYATACGVPKSQARRMWEQAANRAQPTGATDNSGNQNGSTPRVTRGRIRSLELVHKPVHLLQVMHQLHLSAGHPSLRELQKRARKHGLGALPRSTLGDVLAGIRMPSERLLVTYVRTCGEPEHRVVAWLEALSRARDHCRADGGGDLARRSPQSGM